MMGNQILNQDNNNHDNNVNGDNDVQRIKLDKDSDIDGNIRDTNITFYGVWRNKVIRNEILFHTRLFNIHLGRRIGFTLKELSTYKYRGYLDMMFIHNEKEEKETHQFKPLLTNVIPYGVSKVSFYIENVILLDISLPNTVTTVKFHDIPIKQEFTKGMLPDSVTSLEFDWGTSFNQSLAGGWLPNSLKSLSLTYEFEQDIGVNQLPDTLTELNFELYSKYKGKIAPGSIPSIAAAKPLDYAWECECEKELTNQESSNVPTIIYGTSQCIKEGDIPYNAISIKFSKLFNSEIQGALPSSLKSLEFEYSQNIPTVVNVLSSSNLTSVNMGGYNLPLISNLFPQSITSIKFHKFNQPIIEGYFYNYTNLKSLEFGWCFNQIIPVKTLPQSLASLKLGWDFNHVITENTLPPSLTFLSLNCYPHPLNVNVLPTSLSTLKLGCSYHTLNEIVLPPSLLTLEIRSSRYKLGTDQKLPSSITSLSLGTRFSRKEFSIPVGSLPCNLKELYISYPNLKQDLTKEGILPKSIQSIYLSHLIDKNYISNLDDNFFKKYIRFILDFNF